MADNQITPEQPGNTRSYKARIAGQKVIAALDGLQTWAKIEVLVWALDKAKAEAASERE